jgi:ZIP family zinc transporter
MLFDIVLYSLLAGSTVFIGGVIAAFFDENMKVGLLKNELTHTMMAFGAGIMLAAVSFVLVPEAIESLSIFNIVFFFILGTFCFYYLDKKIQQLKSSSSQLMALLLDFIPESISLGAIFIVNQSLGLTLALLIALQNLPEAFNSYIELKKAHMSTKKILIILFFLSFIGLLFSMFGYFLLSDYKDINAMLMVFASGGILYIIFQDIAPSVKIRNSSMPVLGVNLGFVVGLLCHLAI